MVRLNERLALTITGTYASDKLDFIRDYGQAVSSTRDLDDAFGALLDRATRVMIFRPGEGFGIGLAGYQSGRPGFRLVTGEYGQGVGYIKDYPLTYFLSGDPQPVQLAEALIKESSVTAQPPTADIEAAIRQIIGECIGKYPTTLGGQVNILTLS